jgi:3-hydroxyacyl-CoA dehydrogenase, NAD binding domain
MPRGVLLSRSGERPRARGGEARAGGPARRCLRSEVIIASSESGLLMSRLQADCRHSELYVIGHPFNPPHLVPLVEVVAGTTPPRLPSTACSPSTPPSATGRSLSAARGLIENATEAVVRELCQRALSCLVRRLIPTGFFAALDQSRCSCSIALPLITNFPDNGQCHSGQAP